MRVVHLYVGWSIVVAFALLWLWGMGARLVRRNPGAWFWHLLALVQIVIVVQAVAGVVLFITGGRMPILHYFYGSLFPAITIVVAHVVARRREGAPWIAFAWAAFFCFGLTLRALTIGLGIGT